MGGSFSDLLRVSFQGIRVLEKRLGHFWHITSHQSEINPNRPQIHPNRSKIQIDPQTTPNRCKIECRGFTDRFREYFVKSWATGGGPSPIPARTHKKTHEQRTKNAASCHPKRIPHWFKNLTSFWCFFGLRFRLILMEFWLSGPGFFDFDGNVGSRGQDFLILMEFLISGVRIFWFWWKFGFPGIGFSDFDGSLGFRV